MSGNEFEILKLILDKGLLALLVVIVGFWINKRLELFKNEQLRLNELARQNLLLENELRKQRDTRGFDKKLDWYERTINALHDMAIEIQVASTHEWERDDKENRTRRWRKVQSAQLELDRLNAKAELYASNEALQVIAQISKEVEKVANKTDAFTVDLDNTEEIDAEEAKMKSIDKLPEKLLSAASPLAKEARRQLGFEETLALSAPPKKAIQPTAE
ncbi:MAG TPA: hypothetical protein VJ749_02115 [Pyrinomonadaceae bacterium]|nr:hypothetical protein [Pyrinomonadaceae bacterium]